MVYKQKNTQLKLLNELNNAAFHKSLQPVALNFREQQIGPHIAS